MENTISSDLIRGHIDTIILYALLDGDKFAQQISEAIESKSNGDYVINQATLYSSLKRLENLKFVNAYWNDSVGGRRRYFKLTDLGKNTVEENLSNWSRSKVIIDRLMDIQPQRIVVTQQVPQVVPEIVQPSVQPILIEEKSIVNEEKIVITEKIDEPVKAETIVEPQIQTSKPVETIIEQHEVNFRNILNELIKETKPKEVKTAPEIKEEYKELKPESKKLSQEPIKPVKVEKAEEKLKLNETITVSNYNKLKSANSNSSIDYGEMALQAEKEGYKLRFATKESKKAKGSIYANKIRFVSALATFMLVIIEYLIVMLCFKDILNPSLVAVLVSIGALASFPISISILFGVKPYTLTKPFKKDSVLTALIIIFNLILITFALDLLIGIDFNDSFYLMISFIIPCILYFDILVYFIIRYTLSKKKIFTINN